ncbi:MAG: hypothetical protein ACEPO8_03450 [Rhodothermaceae bacterium]
MLKPIKNKISNYLARRKYLKEDIGSVKFNDFFNNSDSFLILMPNEENEFRFGLKVAEFLAELEKQITILTPVKFSGKIPQNKNTKIIHFAFEDVTKFNLPSDFLANKLNRKKFDVVMDLERFENLFYSSLTHMTQSKFKIGFQKEKLNEFYNILIDNKNERPEFCYDDMIESLKMF